MAIAILAGAGIIAGAILARHLLETARGAGCPRCDQVCNGGQGAISGRQYNP
ncbi:hypothetical protein SEF58_10750 [Neomoorella humiferrea]|uniref:hypothetical protein n=1 Tax=Neomoorella humiferrea TaxID=676965 RepID=UPI003D89B4BA